MKEFTVKQDRASRLRVKQWKCVSPSTLNAVEFIQECFDKDGEVDFSSTYQFFMSDQDIATLCKGLLE